MEDDLRPEATTDHWIHKAACIDLLEPDYWFPESRSDNKTASEAAIICHTVCPVRLECLKYSCRVRPETGIFGGVGPRDRHDNNYDFDRLAKIGNRYRKSLK